jgi:hypothetical protein
MEILVILRYPCFNEWFRFIFILFHQIISLVGGGGLVIMQDKKPITFYSRKLNKAQKRYTTTERTGELLSAIENYKQYKNILLGYHQPITVFTDHKSTFNGLKASDRVLLACWLLLLEEYGVTFEYLPGKKNVVEDAFEYLPGKKQKML